MLLMIRQSPHQISLGSTPLCSLSDHSSKPYQVQVDINGIAVTMELDSGASMSILSESEFQKLGRSGTQLVLEKTSVSLKTYTSEALNVRAKVVVTDIDGASIIGGCWSWAST